MNFNILSLAVFSLSALLFTACGGGKEKTERGMEYIYRINNKGEKPKKDDVVQFHLHVYNDKDSLLGSTRDLGRPFAHKISNDPQLISLEDGMKLCGAGDSITFFLAADSLPQGFIEAPKGSILRFELTTVKIQSETDFLAEQEAEAKKMREEMMKKVEAQKPIDDAIITKYLADNKINNAKKTASGLYYVINKPGSGKSPVAGDEVKVHYTGTLLDGTKFDSSVDRGQPFSFQLGRGRVIQGWDEGIALLKKGAKATFFIPSSLAYGPQGAGATIKPFSVLKFEIELLSF
jgi:FKBP-type peptidyl-prolyl cis-trans isomerase